MLSALVFTSISAAEQPATYRAFDPERDCDPMPALIRDAAKNAGIAIKVVCYISDREKFALKAGEAFATDLDRVGDMVRVVVPFGHLLLVNGTEPAVQMAARFYDSENRKRSNAARFTGEQELGVHVDLIQRPTEALRALKESYTALFKPYNHSIASAIPQRSKAPRRK